MKRLLVIALLLTGCGDDFIMSQRVPVAGPRGPAGEQGKAGADGADGKDGLNGANGTNGTNGLDGSSCSVATVAPSVEAPNGGALVTCSDSSVLLLNGAVGPQGEQGPVSPHAITEIIDPCGDASGIYDEVILRTYSGRLLASFSDNVNGYNTRLSELTPGNYATTDGSGCHFSVDSAKNVSW